MLAPGNRYLGHDSKPVPDIRGSGPSSARVGANHLAVARSSGLNPYRVLALV